MEYDDESPDPMVRPQDEYDGPEEQSIQNYEESGKKNLIPMNSEDYERNEIEMEDLEGEKKRGATNKK